MALGKFVFEGKTQRAVEKLSEFLDSLMELAAENPGGVLSLEKVGARCGWGNATDVIMIDAQWCDLDRTAISLLVEGSCPDVLTSVAGIASLLHEDITVFYSVTEFESRVAVTNDTCSKYYDSRLIMLLSVNPKLARVSQTLYGSLQDVVGGAYRFNDENNMRQFVFETFGFRPATREQIAEIVELYSYQMLMDSGLNLNIDEALTNTEFLEFVVNNRNEAVVS